jgi:hypothetical protein
MVSWCIIRMTRGLALPSTLESRICSVWSSSYYGGRELRLALIDRRTIQAYCCSSRRLRVPWPTPVLLEAQGSQAEFLGFWYVFNNNVPALAIVINTFPQVWKRLKDVPFIGSVSLIRSNSIDEPETADVLLTRLTQRTS